MQVDKIYTNNINIQTPQKTENTLAQAESSARESSIETSVYNQKGVQLPFCGLWSMSGRFEQECIDLLNSARNGKLKKFTKADIDQILKILSKEPNTSERPNILKEAFCLTWDETIPDGVKKIDFYDINCEPIPNKFFKKFLKLVSGRDERDRLALLEFTKYELDNDATEPIGAFLQLPESRKQELIPFLRRITDLNTPDFFDPKPNGIECAGDLYDYFRSLVYALDDLSHTRRAASKREIKEELINITIKDDYFEKLQYPDEKTREDVLKLIKDMNDYVLERIVK